MFCWHVSYAGVASQCDFEEADGLYATVQRKSSCTQFTTGTWVRCH
jgi:hypothetical protein